MYIRRLFVLFAVFAVILENVCVGQEGAEGYKKEIEITPLVRTSTTVAGQSILYPRTNDPQVTALLVEIPPGAETGWHTHPFPIYVYVLSGELTVEIAGGKTNTFKTGDAIVESVNLLHNGRSGTQPTHPSDASPALGSTKNSSRSPG